MSSKNHFPKIKPSFLVKLESLVLSDIAFTKSRAWPGHLKRLQDAGVVFLIISKDQKSISLLPGTVVPPTDAYARFNVAPSLEHCLSYKPKRGRPVTTFVDPKLNRKKKDLYVN